MRWTKAALLIFGLGMALGLAIVAAEIVALERVASTIMALGLVLLPVGLAADAGALQLARRLWMRRRGKGRAEPGKPRRASAAPRRPARARTPARTASRRRR